MNSQQLWYLSRINLFADLDAKSLAHVGGISPMVRVPRGSTIARPSDTYGVLYLLMDGRARLYRLDAQGRTIALAILGAGNVFGGLDLVSLTSVDVYAQAMTDCLICTLRQTVLERLIREHPEVGLRLIAILSQRVRELEAHAASLAHEDVRRRVLRVLVALAEQYGVREGELTRLDVPLSHEELAGMVGSTRETVTGTLSRLGREGVVRTGRQAIAVHAERAKGLLKG